MKTIIYVHGTGVRKDEYGEALRSIERSFLPFPGVKVVPCLWGDSCGARLNTNGSSIPTYNSTRGIGEYEDDDESIALWELLYTDPLCELRAITIDEKSKASFHPLEMSPGEKFKYRIKNHEYSSTFLKKLKQFEIDNVFDDALEAVLNSDPFKSAVNFKPDVLIDEHGIIARAVAAVVISICEKKEKCLQFLYDAVMRDEFVKSLTSEIGGASRSIFSVLAKPFAYLVKTKFTDHMERQRGAITDKAYMMPGDTLLYQARGDDISAFIRSRIEKEDSPVVLIAHSLGGVACVELLIRNNFPQVKLLVTMGSQAPFFYEINALRSLPYGETLPEHFPEWINIYNLRDFLSYVGSGIFPGRVTDIPVSSRQPFPKSHNALAYLSNKGTWEAILPRIKELHE